MKKFLTVCAILGAAITIHSCKSGDTFTVSGTLKNPGSLKEVYLMAADSTTVTVVDSASLSNGSFEFKHAGPFENLYKLRAGSTMFDIIAKNGDHITFETTLSDPTHAYTVTGSDESSKIQEFNKISSVFIAKATAIDQEYEEKAQKLGKESDSLTNIYRPIFAKNQDAYYDAIIKFVNANTNSLAAFYAASSLDQMRCEKELVDYADQIKGKFADNPAVQRFQKGIALIRPISIGHKAPDFTVTSITGTPVKLSDYKGKYVMLDFWASWCMPCRAENPNVVKQYAAFKDKGFNILGISLDSEKAPWEQAVAHDKLTWTHVSDLKKFDGPTERLYNIMAIPSNFIIDPQGVIVAKNITGPDLEEFLNKTFNKPE